MRVVSKRLAKQLLRTGEVPPEAEQLDLQSWIDNSSMFFTLAEILTVVMTFVRYLPQSSDHVLRLRIIGAGGHSQYPLTCDESSCQITTHVFLREPAPFKKMGPQYNVVVIGPCPHSARHPTPF